MKNVVADVTMTTTTGMSWATKRITDRDIRGLILKKIHANEPLLVGVFFDKPPVCTILGCEENQPTGGKALPNLR